MNLHVHGSMQAGSYRLLFEEFREIFELIEAAPGSPECRWGMLWVVSGKVLLAWTASHLRSTALQHCQPRTCRAAVYAPQSRESCTTPYPS